MATKKKSTTRTKKSGAKSKSTAKKSTRSAAASKKTTTKRAEVKVTKTASAAKDVFKKLNGWNWIMVLAYVVLGGAILAYSETVTRSVTTTYLTNDPLSGAEETVFVQATKTLFDLNIAYLVAAVLFVAAFKHLLAATVMRKRYEADLKAGTNRSRWLGHGIGDGLAVAGVGLVIGISDIATLFALLAFVFISTVAVISAHKHIASSHRTGRLVYWAGVLLVLAPWIIIGHALLSANRLGSGETPTDYMYYLSGAVFVFYIMYMLIERMRHRGSEFAADYSNIEWSYMITGFALKVAFAGIIFNYLLK